MRGIQFCNLDTLNYRQEQVKIKVKILSRDSIILDQHVGKSFFVHTGRSFYKILVNSRMKGHRFGEFCLTRVPFVHKRKKLKKKGKKK